MKVNDEVYQMAGRKKEAHFTLIISLSLVVKAGESLSLRIFQPIDASFIPCPANQTEPLPEWLMLSINVISSSLLR